MTTAATAIDDRAAELLRELAGPGAAFREHQLEAVRDLVDDRARVLCVQRTGWGKSAVYFLATALLREAGAGPTLIVSPLLALMRNQIAAAERLGIRAHTINSTNRDEWDEVRELLDARRRRPAADQPRAAQQPAVPRRDAAAVRRAGRAAGGRRGALHHRLGPRLPARLPAHRRHARAAARGRRRCCARRRPPTTAWSADVAEQLGVGRAGALRTYRGPLGRTSLRFEVVELPGAGRPAGLARQHLPELPGSGIVYTLTKRDADLVAEWLNGHGDRRRGLQRRQRDRAPRRGRGAAAAQRAQGGGRHQRARAWATTSPTSASSCTTRRPARVIAYYQQVGRAGPRDRARRGRAAARRARTAGSRTSSSSRRSRAASWSTACSSALDATAARRRRS